MFLAVGVVLLVWAWGNWMYRASMPTEEGSFAARRVDSEPRTDALRTARSSSAVLLLGFVLVLVFLVGSYAIVRGSRRFREAFLRPKLRPTSADDVWAMHKLPEAKPDPDD